MISGDEFRRMKQEVASGNGLSCNDCRRLLEEIQVLRTHFVSTITSRPLAGDCSFTPDPDCEDGIYLGYVEAVEIGDITIEGPRTAIDFKTHKLSRAKNWEGDNTLRIGRLQVPALSYKSWVGNWCWDAAKVRGVHALRILNHLASKPHWQCTKATCDIYKAFNERRRVTPKEWQTASNA